MDFKYIHQLKMYYLYYYSIANMQYLLVNKKRSNKFERFKV